MGFVKNALLIFKSGQKSGDYHESMNYDNFSKWVFNKLIPNLPPNSVIVLDNAQYHNTQENKKPTMSSLKQSIMDWLVYNGIPFEQPTTKAELMTLVAKVPCSPIFKIDKFFYEAGYQVVRLPPYHPDLSPIELVWGDIKGRVGQCVSDCMDLKRKLAEQSFAEFSQEKWVKCCSHIKTIKEEYWRNDSLMDVTVDQLIISVNTGDSSDSESSSASESEQD